MSDLSGYRLGRLLLIGPDHRLQERHARAQFGADLFDLMIAPALPLCLEPAALRLLRQLLRIGARTNLREHLPHFVLGLLRDNARAAGGGDT